MRIRRAAHASFGIYGAVPVAARRVAAERSSASRCFRTAGSRGHFVHWRVAARRERKGKDCRAQAPLRICPSIHSEVTPCLPLEQRTGRLPKCPFFLTAVARLRTVVPRRHSKMAQRRSTSRSRCPRGSIPHGASVPVQASSGGLTQAPPSSAVVTKCDDSTLLARGRIRTRDRVSGSEPRQVGSRGTSFVEADAIQDLTQRRNGSGNEETWHGYDMRACPVIMERPAQVTKSWVTLRAATPRVQSHMERGAGRWGRIHDLSG